MQRGVVLIVTLVMLLLMSFLASSLYENHLLQLRMAGNDQSRSEALRATESVLQTCRVKVATRPPSFSVSQSPRSGNLMITQCNGAHRWKHCSR